MCSRLMFGAALLLTLGLAGSAYALNAETVVDLGDKIYGSIETAGDFDRLTFDAPRDAELSFSLKPLDEGLGLSFVLYPPDAPTTPEPIDAYYSVGTTKVKLKNYPVRVSGDWVLEIRAAPGTTGRYKLKTKIEYRSKWKTVEPIDAYGETPFPFAAAFGSLLKIRVKIDDGEILPEVKLLESPVGPSVLPPDLSQSDIPLNYTGEYAVIVENTVGAPGAIKMKLKVKTVTADPRKLYLSPRGYGPAPTVDSVNPSKGLQGALLQSVLVEGEGFVAGATVSLRRNEDQVPASDVVVISDTEITCTLDLENLKTKTWELVVENPSGGDDERSFRVQDPGSISLPPGVMRGTEVWHLDFNDDFAVDLAQFGLTSISPQVSEKALKAVKHYVLYDLREIFGIRGGDGKVRLGAVPISFVLSQPTSLVGEPGVDYNRLAIGGEIRQFEPVSDNPNIAWGRSIVDPGNGVFDDLSREAGPGLGLFVRALSPSGPSVTSAWAARFSALFVNPLTIDDLVYFSPDFDPATAQEGARYLVIDSSIRALAHEIAAVAAHHIGRAMGLTNGATGLSSTPAQVGAFAELAPLTFTETEFATLVASAKVSKLPGTAVTLNATYFPLRGLAEYLLPEVQTGTAVSFSLPTAGGRPNLLPEELDYQGYSGTLPNGFVIDQGTVGGSAPYLVNGSFWYYGPFKFGLRIIDPITMDEDRPDHRINVVINLALVPQAQVAQAAGINTQVRAAP